MFFRKRYLFLVVLIVCLSGCASLSEEECLAADWQGVGYRDGLNGRIENTVAEHQSACSEYNIKLNLDEYLGGREQGLLTYCQKDSGFRMGRSGNEYNYVCPSELEAVFLEGYQHGRKIFLQERKVKMLEKTLQKHEKALEEVELTIKKTENRLVSEGVSKSERKGLLIQLRQLEQDQTHSLERRDQVYWQFEKAQTALLRMQ